MKIFFLTGGRWEAGSAATEGPAGKLRDEKEPVGL